MFKWLARRMIRRALRAHQAGNIDGVLATYAEDVHFTFPGRSSWAADLRGKEAVRSWLQRFYDTGLRLDVHDILIDGPPWKMRVCLQFTDSARDERGTLVYENRGVIYATTRWGKIASYTVFEDTEKVATFDRYLKEVAAA